MNHDQYDTHLIRRRKDPIGVVARRFVGHMWLGLVVLCLAGLAVSALAGIVTALARNLVLKDVLVTLAVGVPACALCGAVGWWLERLYRRER